jgi:hypothetical protein
MPKEAKYMHKTNLKSNRPTTRGALGDGDLDFKLTYDDAVPGNTVWTFSDVGVGDVPQGYAGYSSLNILCPDELSFHYTLPAGWSATESDQGGMRSLNFYISNPAANGQPADVERFLQSLSTSFTLTTPWDYPPVGSEISVMIDAAPTSGFIDGNGELHIYEFVRGTITWMEAYNAAHARIVNGEHGYLATLTSLEEELFVYGSIAKSPGWLGGTRLRYTDGAKIDGSRAIDAQGNISTDINDYTYDTSIANQWYWADGASENGLVFYGTPTVDNTNGPVNGVFSFFSGWYTYNKYPQYQSIILTSWQESNNYGGEYCLQFAQNGSASWNDLEYNRADTYYNSGYYVEYGPFPVGTGFTGRGSANLEIPLQYDVHFDVNNPDCPLTYPNQSLWTGKR